jgi:hypothetical protein
MNRRFILLVMLLFVVVIGMFGTLVNYLMLDSLENPLNSGNRLGPIAHTISRLIPNRLSTVESESFQGLTNPRNDPDTILIYDISKLSEEEQIQAKVVQGFMNREKPTLYTVNSEKDEFWLSKIDAEKVEIKELDYTNYQKIKYNPDSINQKYLAITLAGVHNALPVTEGDKLLVDLSTKSDDQIYDWMIQISKQTNKDMISFRNGKIDHIDFIVKNKMFLSPLAMTGSDPLLQVDHKSKTEVRVLDEIMSEMNPDCAMVGYNINSGILGEYEAMNYLSKHGCFSIPVPGVPNLSFFSAMEKDVPKHTLPSTNATLEDKTYVVILMSDGDNLDLPYSKYEHFAQPHKTPLGWSISPFLNDFAPPIFDYYSANIQEGDTFVTAPSGGGFGYPSKNKNLLAFIEHTDHFMRESNLEYMWLLDHPFRGYSPELLDKFSQISTGMFMEYVIIRPYANSIEHYGDKLGVWSSSFVEKKGNIAERIVMKTPNESPGFLFVGVEMRYNTPQHIDSEIAKLDPNKYEVVSVPDFFNLIKQSNSL